MFSLVPYLGGVAIRGLEKYSGKDLRTKVKVTRTMAKIISDLSVFVFFLPSILSVVPTPDNGYPELTVESSPSVSGIAGVNCSRWPFCARVASLAVLTLHALPHLYCQLVSRFRLPNSLPLFTAPTSHYFLCKSAKKHTPEIRESSKNVARFVLCEAIKNATRPVSVLIVIKLFRGLKNMEAAACNGLHFT